MDSPDSDIDEIRLMGKPVDGIFCRKPGRHEKAVSELFVINN